MFKDLLSDESLTVTAADRSSAQDFVEHNEFGIALDTLLDAIEDRGGRLSRTQKECIVALGQKMDIDPARWQNLEAE